MQPKNQNWEDAIFYFILIATVLFIFFGTVSCNPSKRILRNPVKRDQMAAQIIKLGYCINDTTIVEIRDTTTTIDTVDIPVIITDTFTRNDTVFFWETKYLDIVRTNVITKKVDRVVIDSGKVQVLMRDLAQTKAALANSDVRRKHWRNQFGAAMTTLFFAFVSLVVLIKYKK